MLFKNDVKMSSFEKDDIFTSFLNNYSMITQLTLDFCETLIIILEFTIKNNRFSASNFL